MREDATSAELFAEVVKDAALGRMSEPASLELEDTLQYNFAPRFGVTQGTRPDGSAKVRPIDDMSASAVNAATIVSEKFSYDSLDLLLHVAEDLSSGQQVCTATCLLLAILQSVALLQEEMALFKADIDAAYRRVPIRPGAHNRVSLQRIVK